MGDRTFLRSIRTIEEKVVPGEFPFDIPAFRGGISLDISTPVTFFVGANGAGKSTLLEGLADLSGFNLAGGNRNHLYEQKDTTSPLSVALKLSWLPKVTEGFFMRAETLFNFASYIEEIVPDLRRDGRRSIHDQSHGEFFLSLFERRFKRGIYILDEPEAALSPVSQMAFLAVIRRLEKSGKAQFLIATHSPILLCYPGATVFEVSDEGIVAVDYRETEHYRLTRDFLNCPEMYFRHLFDGEE